MTSATTQEIVFHTCVKCQHKTVETVGKCVDGKWLCWTCYCDTQRHADLCECGHSRGWHTKADACCLDGCKCRAFDEVQS